MCIVFLKKPERMWYALKKDTLFAPAFISVDNLPELFV